MTGRKNYSFKNGISFKKQECRPNTCKKVLLSSTKCSEIMCGLSHFYFFAERKKSTDSPSPSISGCSDVKNIPLEYLLETQVCIEGPRGTRKLKSKK